MAVSILEIPKQIMNATEQFEATVNAHYERVFKFAMSLTRVESDARDLTQQTFYVWATKGHQLRDISKTKTWLFTTLHRAFLEARRRQTWFPQHSLEEVADQLPVLSTEFANQADCSQVLRALAMVDENYQAAVALFCLEDCSYRNIAATLNVPIGTVKSRIARGITQLREILLSNSAGDSFPNGTESPPPPVRTNLLRRPKTRLPILAVTLGWRPEPLNAVTMNGTLVPRSLGNRFPACSSHSPRCESDSFGAVTSPRSSQMRKNKQTMKHVMMNERNKTNVRNETSAPHPLRSRALAALGVTKMSAGALGLLLLVSQASAASFSFSTGNPDGKIATLSRPSSPGKIQTETADDFIIVSNTTLISQATFTGLIPSGAPLSSALNVEIEIYHVFPNDSDTNRTLHVPTRMNSPGDVEIDGATRDGLDCSLSFSVTLVNASFTASNSVVNGIHAATNQTTHGEGPMTGEEVLISVTFNPPISLPPGHYFFRPEVLLSSGDFLWLSAPKPTAPPLFVGDLQSWIRNDNLAPDWLRIGADIVGAGAFNASFSLSGETDADGDGVADSLDLCPGTPAGAIVDANGCSIDQIAPCSGPASGGTWKNHGQYVSAVAQAAEAFVEQRLVSEAQAEEIVAQAAQSNCGANRSASTAHRSNQKHRNR